MASVVTKTRGPRAHRGRATTAGKGAEAWGQPMRHLLGFFIRAIWRFDYLDFDLATAKQPSKGASGVPNSSIALAFIIISERCYS